MSTPNKTMPTYDELVRALLDLTKHATEYHIQADTKLPFERCVEIRELLDVLRAVEADESTDPEPESVGWSLARAQIVTRRLHKFGIWALPNCNRVLVPYRDSTVSRDRIRQHFYSMNDFVPSMSTKEVATSIVLREQVRLAEWVAEMGAQYRERYDIQGG